MLRNLEQQIKFIFKILSKKAIDFLDNSNRISCNRNKL